MYLKIRENIRQRVLDAHTAELSLHSIPGLFLSQTHGQQLQGLVFPEGKSAFLMGARSLYVGIWTRGQRVQWMVPEVDGSQKTLSFEAPALITN